ncbi:hypothetical protein Z043_117895 [Scleropages formosus]|uniref:GRF-type domain-containing protein n=1 Tax=Scleropages formosus TaxID=113540 RepID=A0A0P7WJD0_SCLFO|nr:hypothetical protein Z043_117895 [Scleropages formosus]
MSSSSIGGPKMNVAKPWMDAEAGGTVLAVQFSVCVVGRVSGPALLFERLCRGRRSGRRFFACSACRDRKDCSFFQWEDEQVRPLTVTVSVLLARVLLVITWNDRARSASSLQVSEARLLARERENETKQPRPHAEWRLRLGRFVCLPLDQRRFCKDCQLLLLPNEWGDHSGHTVLHEVTAARLRRPSLLLRPLENKKSNAQYLFAERSCRFLLELVRRLGFQKVLCVGTPRATVTHGHIHCRHRRRSLRLRRLVDGVLPSGAVQGVSRTDAGIHGTASVELMDDLIFIPLRLHEAIKLRNMEESAEPMRSLLLDIDFSSLYE